MALDLDSMDMAHGPARSATARTDRTMAPTVPPHGVTPHNVPDRHALQRWPPWPTIGSIPAYDPILHSEASNSGKDFLRMAGIVKMLHSHKPQYDSPPAAQF